MIMPTSFVELPSMMTERTTYPLTQVAAIACLALGVFRHDEVPSQLGSSVAFEAAAQVRGTAR